MFCFHEVHCFLLCVAEQEVDGDNFLSLTASDLLTNFPTIKFPERKEILKIVRSLNPIDEELESDTDLLVSSLNS